MTVAAMTVVDATPVATTAVDQTVVHVVQAAVAATTAVDHVATLVATVVVTVANTFLFHNGVYGLKVA